MAHDDLDDDLPQDIFGGLSVPKEDLYAPITNFTIDQLRESQTYTEMCKACRGSGSFYSYTGRRVGPCFKCKGTGQLTFKTSPVSRQNARKGYAEKKARKEAEVRDFVAAWIEENPAEHEWLYRNSPRNEFAASLAESLNKYGQLTENQLAAVRRSIAKEQAQREERAAQAQAAVDNAVDVNIQPIVEAFIKAMVNKVARPKLRLAHFRFDRAPDHGRNPGAIYVLDMDDDQRYLGKIMNGKLIRSRDCTDELEKEIVEVCADPHQAAIAYGQRYGSCSVCGRTLTNHASIDAGIGPVCASKYGWA